MVPVLLHQLEGSPEARTTYFALVRGRELSLALLRAP